MKTCDERSIFAIPIFFPFNIYFYDFSAKNYLKNKSRSDSSVSCLLQDSEMSNFFLKLGRGYPGWQRLFMRGFQFRSSVKK